MPLIFLYRQGQYIVSFVFAVIFSGMLQPFMVSSLNKLPEKIITVNVNESGIISVGSDTISSDELAKYLQQRLFKSYAGTGKMFDAIKLVADKNLEAAIIEIIKKEIAAGQKRALTELCLEKYKKMFDEINSRQQEKLKKNFPVLFQTSYD